MGAALRRDRKEFSHVGKVLDLDGQAACRTSTRQSSWRGPITASASSKDGQSFAGRATYSPHARVHACQRSRRVVVLGGYRARIGPKSRGAEAAVGAESLDRPSKMTWRWSNRARWLLV